MKQGIMNATQMKALLISVVIGIGAAVAGAAVLAVAINKEVLGMESAKVAIYLIRLLGAAIGAVAFTRTVTEQRLIWSIVYGAVYCVVCLSATALVFGGMYESVVGSVLGVIAVCAALGMAGNMHKNKRGFKKYKMHNR